MEFKYIWIKDYGVIQNLNVNFDHSGTHSFDYDGNKLSLLPRTKSPISFGEKITGVTAIAGMNGSGKSSLCEAVLSAVATFKANMFGNEVVFEGIVCFNDKILYQRQLTIENIDQLQSAGYTIEAFDESPFESMKGEWVDDVTKSGFVYYSNVLDLRSGFDMTNLVNISTEAMIHNEYKYGTDYPDFDDKSSISELERYKLGQGYRVMHFYLKHRNHLPFKGPSNFILRSTYSYNNRFLNIRQAKIAEHVMDYLQREESYIFDGIVKLDRTYKYDDRFILPGKEAKNLTHQLYKLNLLKAYVAATSSSIEIESIQDFLKQDPDRYLSGIPRSIQRLAAIHKCIVDVSETEDIEFAPDFMRTRYETGDWRYILIGMLQIRNDVDQQNGRLLHLLIRAENVFFRRYGRDIGRISNYSFSPYFSSGEYSFLSLFSRLDDVLTRYSNGDQARDKLLLFLDEPEIGFHPDWSKKFLKYLLQYLNDRTHGFDYQLIITTHSPYLLSDLPARNVVLLDRPEGGHTRIVTTNKLETFGANINDLLADTFFLHDGTIGEFAKDIIQQVIDILNTWRQEKSRGRMQASASQKKEILDIILLIGDIIIRNKLLDMYWEVTADVDAINSEIGQLEERINQLKSRRDDNN